jgi:hypothetical protein
MVMNSLVTRPIAFPLLVTFGLTVLLLPPALWQQGEVGLWVVLGSSGVVAFVILVTALAQGYLPNLDSHPLKQLALVSGLRMSVSLAAVLGVCLALREHVSAALMLYAVPFYLGLLAAESAVMIAQARTTPHR